MSELPQLKVPPLVTVTPPDPVNVPLLTFSVATETELVPRSSVPLPARVRLVKPLKLVPSAKVTLPPLAAIEVRFWKPVAAPLVMPLKDTFVMPPDWT